MQDKLRGLELDSIQDYIAESDNLVGLHAQVRLNPLTLKPKHGEERRGQGCSRRCAGWGLPAQWQLQQAAHASATRWTPLSLPAACTHASSMPACLLRPQIQGCDAILAHMEALLGRFQGDLSTVSEEIRALQVQSASMSTRLRNRRAAEGVLGAFLEQALVSEDLIHQVLDAPVSLMAAHLIAAAGLRPATAQSGSVVCWVLAFVNRLLDGLWGYKQR